MVDEAELVDPEPSLQGKDLVEKLKPVPASKRDEPEFFRLATHVAKGGRLLLTPSRLFTLWQGLDNARRVRGDIVEIGAQLGGSAFFIAQALKLLDLSDRPFYVISKFRVPRGALLDSDKAEDEGPREARFEDVRDLLHPFRNTEVRQGTVEEATKGLKVSHYAFAHINITSYASTHSALGHVFSRLSPGGLIVLSQFATTKRDVVKDAVLDYLKGQRNYWFFRLPTMQALLMRT